MKKFICIDIGGTSIKYGYVYEDGIIIQKGEMDTEALLKGGAGILSKCKAICRAIINKYKVVDGICISTAGMVDPDEGKIIYSIEHLIPGYTGMGLKAEIEKEFDIRCEVENDVNCAALGEAWLGSGRDSDSSVCMTIGTGIGGAVIINGKIHHGHSNSAGEIGYININGKPFQDQASTTSLVKAAAAKKGIDPSEINGKIIFEGAKNGDNDYISAIEDLIKVLAEGISNVAYLINPEVIILGGGIMAQEEFIRPRLKKELKKVLVETVYKNTRIEFAYMKNNAGMLGALRNFLNKN